MARNKSSKFGVADGFFEDIVEPEKTVDKDSFIEVSLTELHPFRNHPFKVNDDEKMEETVESIKEHGVLVPGIVRKREKGGYELISGHRRKRACEIAGLKKMPVFVKELTDEEAIIIMVDSNIQREEILPSEKAKAYKMKYEAMKHQGKADGFTGDSLNEMSREAGESRTNIQRYISIAELSDEFLSLIDEKKMGVTQGVDIASLKEDERETLYEIMDELGVIPTMLQTGELKLMSKAGRFDTSTVKTLLSREKKPAKRKVVFKEDYIEKYFPKEYTDEQINKVITELLEEWKKRN